MCNSTWEGVKISWEVCVIAYLLSSSPEISQQQHAPLQNPHGCSWNHRWPDPHGENSWKLAMTLGFIVNTQLHTPVVLEVIYASLDHHRMTPMTPWTRSWAMHKCQSRKLKFFPQASDGQVPIFHRFDEGFGIETWKTYLLRWTRWK